MHKVFFSLGSNLGDRMENLRLACQGLADHLGSLKTSPVYETEPWGFANQPAFLNMAAAANTSLAPLELLDLIKRLEQDLGREPTFRYGPRKIDIDILFFGILVVNTPGLQIPHPRMAERAFVLVPLADLAPDHIHPTLFRTVSEMLVSVDAKSVKFYQPFPNQPPPLAEDREV
jgi:2-amino-4-hydroxy-6-hydroxymethyldihydropteridine diphosphokinase